MDAAARDGLRGSAEGVDLSRLASSAVALAIDGLKRGAPCAGARAGVPALERLLR
jgi:hypothetical protein